MRDGHANGIGSKGMLSGSRPLSYARRVRDYPLSRSILLLVLTFVVGGNVVRPDSSAHSAPPRTVVATPSPTGPVRSSPPQQVVEVRYGQPDQFVVDALPDL